MKKTKKATNSKKNNATSSKKQQSDTNEKRLEKLRKQVKIVFETSGFTSIPTEFHEMHVGLRNIELDMLFIYENILVICEDTSDSHKKEHALKKQEAFDQIEKNKAQFFVCLESEFVQYAEQLKRYPVEEYTIKYLYFTPEDIGFDEETMKRYSLIKFVSPKSIEYLYQMTNSIQKSVRFEVFKFLEIKDEQIGDPSSSGNQQRRVKAAIITPKGYTGLKNGVRIVSFMMSADVLIKNSYVMRKDNWEDAIFLYQRLIKKDRINSIRDYLLKNETAFLNNIIVSLPDDVQFFDASKNPVKLEEIDAHDAYTMEIPDRMNSICVIDGQHRIYAHYESLKHDKNEEQMDRMRKRLHLLVTGIIYPKDMKQYDRTKFESGIFLDINTNAKSVAPEVLIHIESMRDPLSPNGLARAVIESMNKDGPFKDMLETTSLEPGKLKTSSMIKFALKNLVDVNSENRYFFQLWEGNKELLRQGDPDSLKEYIKFCAKNLNMYFSAVKSSFATDWNADTSKLLSVICINGFIIAFGHCMEEQGLKDFEYYEKKISKINVDFSKDQFPYTSSQYNKFAREVINKVFDDVQVTN